MLISYLTVAAGCEAKLLPQRREIDEQQLVQVIGIDKVTGSENDCIITVASKNISGETQSGKSDGGAGEESKGKKALILSAEGKSVFDAVRNIQTHSDKTIFWGHIDYCLIGEEAARENITKYIDFFTRDHELRIDYKIYIVRGSTVKDLIEEFNKSEYYIQEKLESLGKSHKLLGTSDELKDHELIRFLDIHGGSARVPCITLTVRQGNDGQVPDIESCGYALISEEKLVDFIERDISRGVNLIANKIDSSVAVVKDMDGQDVSLEIIQSKTDVIPHFDGDMITGVTLKTKVMANIDEIQSHVDIKSKQFIQYLEAQLSDVLKREMEAVIKKVVENESDCLGICDRISLKSPIKWHKIKNQWLELMLKIKYEVEVSSKIKDTYDIKEPTGSKGEG